MLDIVRSIVPNADHATAALRHLAARLTNPSAVQVSHKETTLMKKIIQTKSIENSSQRYQDSLQAYYADLKKVAATDYSTSHMLRELEDLLDRCKLLESPLREHTFVEEVCRMGRRLHLAA